MDIYESIQKFNEQFGYRPEVVNGENFKPKNKFIGAGMGGSNIASDFLWVYRPELEIISHRSYGLPSVNDLNSYTIIASSYSGGTEEAISAFEEALKKGLSLAVITTGGKLLELAKEHAIPHIQMPDFGIQPRVAVGLSFMAMLKIIGDDDGLKISSELQGGLTPTDYEAVGKSLSEKTKGKIPVIYSSNTNGPLAHDWKISFNENGKIPAFYNIFPELNHNEMISFSDIKGLADKFCFIFLRDSTDLPQIQKRMDITAGLFADKGLPVENVTLENKNGPVHKIFSSVILASWTSYYVAQNYGLDPENVDMIEEFKKLIK